MRTHLQAQQDPYRLLNGNGLPSSHWLKEYLLHRSREHWRSVWTSKMESTVISYCSRVLGSDLYAWLDIQTSQDVRATNHTRVHSLAAEDRERRMKPAIVNTSVPPSNGPGMLHCSLWYL